MFEDNVYILVVVFTIMYLFGLNLLLSINKYWPAAIYTIAYFSLSCIGYWLDEEKGIAIVLEAVLIGTVLYQRHIMNKRINAALKRIEESEKI